MGAADRESAGPSGRCPKASYWSIAVGDTTHDGIVWSYEDPIPGAEAITDHLSFYPDRAQVTVDGVTLT